MNLKTLMGTMVVAVGLMTGYWYVTGGVSWAVPFFIMLGTLLIVSPVWFSANWWDFQTLPTLLAREYGALWRHVQQALKKTLVAYAMGVTSVWYAYLGWGPLQHDLRVNLMLWTTVALLCLFVELRNGYVKLSIQWHNIPITWCVGLLLTTFIVPTFVSSGELWADTVLLSMMIVSCFIVSLYIPFVFWICVGLVYAVLRVLYIGARRVVRV